MKNKHSLINTLTMVKVWT